MPFCIDIIGTHVIDIILEVPSTSPEVPFQAQVHKVPNNGLWDAINSKDIPGPATGGTGRDPLKILNFNFRHMYVVWNELTSTGLRSPTD